MIKKQTNYISYLLRLWQEENDGQLIWRASLEPPGSGERLAFASLRALFVFLETETGETVPRDKPEEITIKKKIKESKND